MALIEHTLMGKTDKVKTAIERIRNFDPITNGFMDEPYFVAYSGGKDSDALRILFDLSNVKYDLVHNHTTVDAPETVYYVRSIPGIQISYPKMSMWKLIVKKRMPPTRIVRYCCSELKERGGVGRIASTGVRWSESVRRKNNRGSLEIATAKMENKIILNADNDENRRLFENCTVKGKRMLNPIIDWTDDDVWEFLDYHGCQSNHLYKCGYKRIGCLGCPMARPKLRMRDFERYPKYKDAYIRTFDRSITKAAKSEKPLKWKTGEECFDWWMTDPVKKKEINEQIKLFEFAEEGDDDV